ncbi:fungal-specific transcription factor domain-containing protein [Xylariaceae sp. FL0662B]|nr:fungal-specific transcription factor domain-containing protein [Xylariaceae sp. FL0662B]
MSQETGVAAVSPPLSENAGPARRVNRSCLVCTQRKVKCNGGYPCSNCESHETSQLCTYRQRTRRQVVRKSIHDQLVDQLQTYSTIVKRAFPGVNLDELAGKDATELAQIVASRASPSSLSQSSAHQDQLSVPLAGSAIRDDGGCDSSESSDADEPVCNRTWDEASPRLPTAFATDDSNGGTLATGPGHRPSFLGATSNSAVLRAIFRLNPSVKEQVIRRTKAWMASLEPASTTSLPVDGAFGALKEQRYIEFYFETLHPITPILNEDEFWVSYRSGRQDPSWLGLLFMVLTIGSIASGSDALHEQYYQKAQSFFNFNMLGMGNFETLQGLCLLGGYYLHYRNAPNMAFAVLGTAHRVAIALGLHREDHRRVNVTAAGESPSIINRTETRRRTWWSLFCLDTWMCVTLGRPTCGRWDPTTMDTLYPSLMGPDDHVGIAIRANCDLCRICNRLVYRFSQLHSPISVQEALAFDAELRGWQASLPPIMLSSPNSSQRISTVREFIRQRYTNVRLVLCRSIILRLASRRGRKPLTPDEGTIISLSHSIASEAIDSIALRWEPNRIHVWNSAWFLFQACLLPLLCITMDRTSLFIEPAEGIAEWRRCIAKALETFEEMRQWMRTSDRTPDLVATVYEAVTMEKENLAVEPMGALTIGDFETMGWYNEVEQWPLGIPWDLGSFFEGMD